MPANFTEEQRKVIRNSLLTIGYDLIREVGVKKKKEQRLQQEPFIISLNQRKHMCQP